MVMQRWRAVPLAFRVGLILHLVVQAVFVVGGFLLRGSNSHDTFRWWIQVIVAIRGVDFAADALLMFGAFELARLLVGRAAQGAKLAAVGWGMGTALRIANAGLSLHTPWSASLSETVSWAWFAAFAIAGLGMAVTAKRAPLVAIAGAAASLILQLPPPLATWLAALLPEHREAYEHVSSAIGIACALVLGGLVLVAVKDVPARFSVAAPDRARVGLEWLSRGLWLRVLSTLAVPLVTLVIAADHRSGGAAAVLANATVVASFVSIGSLTLAGLGALDIAQSQHADVPRTPFLLAGIASLWCAGVAVTQLAHTYRAMTARPDSFALGDDFDLRFSTALTVIQPLVAIAALVAVAIAIAGFAERRGNATFGERAWRIAILVGTLQVTSLAVAHLFVSDAPSFRALAPILLGAVLASIVALDRVARLASDARSLVEAPPTSIPMATIV